MRFFIRLSNVYESVIGIFTKMTKVSRPIAFLKPSNRNGGLINLRGLLSKKFVLVLHLICIGIFIYIVYGNRLLDGRTESERSNGMTCNLPKLNPFDPSMLKSIWKPKVNGSCVRNSMFPLLFTTDFDNNLITLKDPRSVGLDHCCYKHIHRPTDAGSDNTFWESRGCVPVMKNVTIIPIELEFIAVLCETEAREFQVIDAFALLPLKPKMDTKYRASNSKSSLNIAILGLDSISHMHFLRSMPKTHQYLTKNLSAFGMNGYVKIGSNTYPNLMAALTGFNTTELEELCQETNSPIDNCPLIWRNYSVQGYWTSHWENMIRLPTNSELRNKRGFHYARQQTNFSARPLSLYQTANIGHRGGTDADELCLGPRFNLQVLLDNIEKTAVAMARNDHQKYFQLNWDNSIAHDQPTYANMGDDMILSTLEFLKENGFLNQTVFILMSDHGYNLENFQRTNQGRIESRMPFLYFVLPDWFSNKYPTALANLKINQNRLTTPFDLHETLRDFLDMDNAISDDRIITRQFKLNSDEMPRGISLFLPIPLDRTCELAGIPIQWCVCHKSVPISVNQIKIRDAAGIYMKSLSRLLEPYPECASLSLYQIRSAESVQIENEVITIVLETVPGNALFEVVMKFDTASKWIVLSDNRVNVYGNQSACVSWSRELKNYCYCKGNFKYQSQITITDQTKE